MVWPLRVEKIDVYIYAHATMNEVGQAHQTSGLSLRASLPPHVSRLGFLTIIYAPAWLRLQPGRVWADGLSVDSQLTSLSVSSFPTSQVSLAALTQPYGKQSRPSGNMQQVFLIILRGIQAAS